MKIWTEFRERYIENKQTRGNFTAENKKQCKIVILEHYMAQL